MVMGYEDVVDKLELEECIGIIIVVGVEFYWVNDIGNVNFEVFYREIKVLKVFYMFGVIWNLLSVSVFVK